MRRHDHGREVARIVAIDPEVPDAQLALDRSGPVDQHDASAAALGRLDGPVLRRRPGPVAEMALDGREGGVGLDGAGDDDVATFGA